MSALLIAASVRERAWPHAGACLIMCVRRDMELFSPFCVLPGEVIRATSLCLVAILKTTVCGCVCVRAGCVVHQARPACYLHSWD